MGLEPTTFCMAKRGERSHPFAPVRETLLNRRFAGCERTASAPRRTASAAIAAIVRLRIIR